MHQMTVTFIYVYMWNYLSGNSDIKTDLHVHVDYTRSIVSNHIGVRRNIIKYFLAGYICTVSEYMYIEAHQNIFN